MNFPSRALRHTYSKALFPWVCTNILRPYASGVRTHILRPYVPGVGTHILRPYVPGVGTHILRLNVPGAGTHRKHTRGESMYGHTPVMATSEPRMQLAISLVLMNRLRDLSCANSAIRMPHMPPKQPETTMLSAMRPRMEW